jgi:hypothetical protein
MMPKFPSTRIAATCRKKAGNGLTDPRWKKGHLIRLSKYMHMCGFHELV